MAKQYLDIVKSVMRIDTNSFSFDMQQIENRRFMFNPQTGTLILGYPYSGRKLQSSHAEEHAAADTGEAFDDFIRGWIGTGRNYKDGVIHFAPGIPTANVPMFEKGFDTLEMFEANGANKNTVVRAFGEVWEQPLSELIKEVDYMAENSKTHSLENLIEFSKEENTKERVEKLTGILEQGVTELFESETYKRYLSAMAMFHDYSFRNTMLILHQLPTASYVAGFNAWKDHKRYVREGEKSIKIFAPAPYKTKIAEIQKDGNGQIIKDRDGNPVTKEKEITVPAFKAVPVYDISQTDGEPLPELGGGELIGTVDNYENFWQVLKKISPFQIYLEKIEDSETKGYCRYGKDAKIVVDNGMSEIETISVAIHEISHARLHNYTAEELATLPPEEKKTRRMREVEAESVAFVVCKHFGIETGEASFPYIAGWSKNKEMPELKASLSLIQKTSCDIINEIEENLIALEKEQQKVQETQAFNMDSDIHSWYAATYPDDMLGEEIYTGVTFQKLYDMLSVDDIYSIMGVDDSSIRERCFSKIAELMQVDYSVIYDKWLNSEIHDIFAPTIQPVVTILWSESPYFETGQKMPLNIADKLFAHYDNEFPREQGYDKVKFRIDFTYNGLRDNYIGRYDIGDRENGLIKHIENHFKENLNPSFLEAVRETSGQKSVDEVKSEADKALSFFVPYLQLHINLSELEDVSNKALADKNVLETDKAYYSAMCDYVHNSRVTLNNAVGEMKLPEPPQKEDFIKHPTMDELEQKANAGEPVAIMDMINAINEEKKQAKKAEKTDKKPSIKKQLVKDKAKDADELKPKKTTKKKSQEMEV